MVGLTTYVQGSLIRRLNTLVLNFALYLLPDTHSYLLYCDPGS